VSAALLQSFGGDLSESGFLGRIDLGFSDIDLGYSDLSIRRASAMLGYQWSGELLRVRLFAGLIVVDRDFSEDGAGSAEGTYAGLKVMGQVSTTKESPLYVSVSGSYSTVLNQYSAGLQTGWRFGSITFGPEFQISGSDTFEGKKVGLFVQGIKFGGLSISPSAGYAFGGEEDAGKDSPYGDLGVSMQF
jgi:hypothetical protein